MAGKPSSRTAAHLVPLCGFVLASLWAQHLAESGTVASTAQPYFSFPSLGFPFWLQLCLASAPCLALACCGSCLVTHMHACCFLTWLHHVRVCVLCYQQRPTAPGSVSLSREGVAGRV